MEHASESLVIAGSLERCFSVVEDVESYPLWVADIREVQVLERDENQKASLVRFRAGAFGRSANYILRYDYSKAPNCLSWLQTEGDITNKLNGSYVFEATDIDTTLVHYFLEVDLKVPIPGFVKRRVEGHILHAAIWDLKERVELRARQS
ncbi:MAG: cyclase [Firmicutes bacterium]|nr:cyclase [Bacillota bacterium]